MTAKLVPDRYFWIFLIAFLVACGTVPPEQAGNAAATSTPSATLALEPTNTPFFPSPTPLPTATPYDPIPTTALRAASPLPMTLPKFPLAGYAMLFSKDGYLYYQDGNGSPVKLTHIEEVNHHPYFPRLSDDNQEVVFAGEDGSNIYSIKTDGTQEHIIIPSNWLTSFEAGTKLGAVSFIPNTHQLLFETVLCKAQEPRFPCPTSAFLADIDTGEIKKLADLGTVLFNIDIGSDLRNVKVSPDGKMLAIGTLDGVDIFAQNGKLIRDNILPYTPSTSTLLFPSLFWLPDSSGLIDSAPRYNLFYASMRQPSGPYHLEVHNCQQCY